MILDLKFGTGIDSDRQFGFIVSTGQIGWIETINIGTEVELPQKLKGQPLCLSGWIGIVKSCKVSDNRKFIIQITGYICFWKQECFFI